MIQDHNRNLYNSPAHFGRKESEKLLTYNSLITFTKTCKICDFLRSKSGALIFFTLWHQEIISVGYFLLDFYTELLK